jgi:hypothetical protein
MVEEVEKFKEEVSKSLTMLTVKCEMLDQHVPELREKLEYAINTINVRFLPRARPCELITALSGNQPVICRMLNSQLMRHRAPPRHLSAAHPLEISGYVVSPLKKCGSCMTRYV